MVSAMKEKNMVIQERITERGGGGLICFTGMDLAFVGGSAG